MTKSPRSIKHEHRFVISVLFPDGQIKYLAGNAGLSGPDVCLFTTDKEKAISSHIRDTLLMGWPYLIGSHGQATKQKLRGVIHKASDDPIFN